MILFIDSTGFDSLHLAIISSDKAVEKRIRVKYPETEKTLSYVEKFLKSKRLALSDLGKIIVCTGEGSFTGVRVGLSIGLAFSFAKDIPLYAVEKSKLPEHLKDLENIKLKKVSSSFVASYGAEPNITIKKK